MREAEQKIGTKPLRIGSIDLPGRAILAPMSGVTDIGMRRIAARHGASLVVSEMIASSDLIDGRSEARLRFEGEGIHPHVVQIAGCDREPMAEAARMAENAGAHIVDINMGCPCKRVNGRFSGSALMRDPDHAERLIEATVSAVGVPVTVKIRLGWDPASLNAPEIARRAELAGARMVTVHGRTRSQFYKGCADWRAIRAVVDAVSIPVVANGDCASPDDARSMLAASGADGVMIGRGAVGQPWLVGEIAAELDGAVVQTPPISVEDKRHAALEHLDSLLSTMGSHAGLRHSRKHLAAYADLAAGADTPESWHTDRRRLVTTDDPAEAMALLGSLMTARYPAAA